jgi:hypothetical protein
MTDDLPEIHVETISHQAIHPSSIKPSSHPSITILPSAHHHARICIRNPSSAVTTTTLSSTFGVCSLFATITSSTPQQQQAF